MRRRVIKTRTTKAFTAAIMNALRKVTQFRPVKFIGLAVSIFPVATLAGIGFSDNVFAETLTPAVTLSMGAATSSSNSGSISSGSIEATTSTGNSTTMLTSDNSISKAKVSFPFTVTLTNYKNYSISVSAPSTDTSLKGTTNTSNTIPTLSTANDGKSYDSLPTNAWGYSYTTSLSNSPSPATNNVFHQVKPSTAPNTIYSANNVNKEGTDTKYFTIDIAATADSTTPYDTYTAILLITAVATPGELPSNFYDTSSYTMQTMTKAICESATIPNSNAASFDSTGEHAGDKAYTPRVSITDSRDNRKYLIARLADGKCWMVQNLALWGNTNGTTKTVKAYNWYTKELYDYNLPASSATGFSSDTTQNMYNGSYQPGTPNTVGNDGSGATNKNGANSGSYYSWLTAIAQPANPAPLPANDVSADNYTPPTNDGGQVYTSICPKGWRLPTGGTNSGEFENLIVKYDAVITSGDTFNKGTFSSSVWNIGSMYVGRFNNNTLGNSGLSSGWWSGTITSITHAYYLNEGTGNLYPRRSGSRRNGYSVRCVLAS